MLLRYEHPHSHALERCLHHNQDNEDIHCQTGCCNVCTLYFSVRGSTIFPLLLGVEFPPATLSASSSWHEPQSGLSDLARDSSLASTCCESPCVVREELPPAMGVLACWISERDTFSRRSIISSGVTIYCAFVFILLKYSGTSCRKTTLPSLMSKASSIASGKTGCRHKTALLGV